MWLYCSHGNSQRNNSTWFCCFESMPANISMLIVISDKKRVVSENGSSSQISTNVGPIGWIIHKGNKVSSIQCASNFIQRVVLLLIILSVFEFFGKTITYELRYDETNNVAVHPAKNSDQPGHPPNLIRVFAVRMKKPSVLSYPLGAQRRLWTDWVDAQADLSLRWVHSHFVGFVMMRLSYD